MIRNVILRKLIFLFAQRRQRQPEGFCRIVAAFDSRQTVFQIGREFDVVGESHGSSALRAFGIIEGCAKILMLPRRTGAGTLICVSSFNSLIALSSSVAPLARNPPGSASKPLPGWCPRRMTRTCPLWTTTASVVIKVGCKRHTDEARVGFVFLQIGEFALERREKFGGFENLQIPFYRFGNQRLPVVVGEKFFADDGRVNAQKFFVGNVKLLEIPLRKKIQIITNCGL